jgi:glycosyltransferase involved in cell wall biosynthesis
MRILVVLNKSYHEDPRPQRMVSALSQAGHSVSALCFSDPLFSPAHCKNVSFLQCPIGRKRSGRLRYVLEYMVYMLWCSITLALQVARGRYDVLQVFLHPEALVLVGLIPKLAGVRILSDWEDLGYELYRTKYRSCRYDPLPRLIRVFEQIVIAISDGIMFPNQAFLDALSSRGVNVPRHKIIMNAADHVIFASQAPPKLRVEATRLLYTGALSERNGIHVLLEAFAKVERTIPARILTVLGNSIDFSTANLGEKACLSARTYFGGRVSLSKVAAHIRAADIGIIPTSETPFTRCNVPTRLFEFGTVGLPVICADLPGIRHYFDDRHVLFHKPDDSAELARLIIKLIGDYELRQSLAQSLQARCMELAWTRSRETYLGLVECLAGGWHSETCAKTRACKRQRTARGRPGIWA